MSALWIDDPERLAEFCDSVPEGGIIGLDTESDHFMAYRPSVALIQVATVDEAALIDPYALETEDLEPFFELIEEPSIIKILHSCRNDISELDRDFGIDVSNIFDTQIAARFLNYEKVSLDALLDVCCGLKISKKFQRFDWTRRPLPQGPLDYAAGDVLHLMDLRERLMSELDEAGWLQPFREQCSYEVGESGYSHNEFNPEGFRKLKGARDLDGRGRAAARALYVYRHELCDRIDRMPLHVFENRALLEIAKKRPTSVEQLQKIRGLSEQTKKRNAHDILRVVAESLEAPIPPERLRSKSKRPSPEQTDRLKALSDMRAGLGSEIDLPLDLLLNRSTLEYLAAKPEAVDELERVPGLLPWQRERFGARLVTVLSSS